VSLPDWEQSESSKDLAVRTLFIVWVILLVPWLPYAGAVVMVMYGGFSFSGLMIILSVWSYGIAVLVAFALRNRSRKAVLLPVLSIAAIVTSGLFDWLLTHWR